MVSKKPASPISFVVGHKKKKKKNYSVDLAFIHSFPLPSCQVYLSLYSSKQTLVLLLSVCSSWTTISLLLRIQSLLPKL